MIKPTHKPIKDYYATIKAVAKTGETHEMATRSAFQHLLEKLASKRGWTFVAERAVKKDGPRIVPDGTILDGILARGHWEAKDAADDLDAEIEKKKAKGYPLDNIIFEDTQQAVLYQQEQEVLRKDLTDPKQLCQLLTRFIEFAKPPVATFEQAVAKFKEEVPVLAKTLQDRIETAHKDNKKFKIAFDGFMDLCKSSLNPNISQPTVDEMLVQHLLTERLFRTVFNRPDFNRRNVIANEVANVIDALISVPEREKFTKSLDYFYNAIEGAAKTLKDVNEKQQFLNTVYERFFQGYSQKVADTHGIVYTPQEIVDFMCASVDEVLRTEFDTDLGGDDVQILDPCTGTGNFIVNLIKRIPRTNLEAAYKNRLFANEVMLLPYYIAALNIEHAYFERMGDYEPFEGLCFVDTLDMSREEKREMFLSAENAKRVTRQRKAPITVIIGNPPYNVGQVSENDQNKNRKYKITDQKIRETYSKDSRATNKNALSDMYVKFFRWAVDRLEERDGIVCYVSNNSFVDQVAFDGMRRHLLRDFTHIYHVDLHGNVRQNPKLSGTKHNVFGIQVGVGITVAVRRKTLKAGKPGVRYARVPEFWTRFEKCDWLGDSRTMSGVEWKKLKPDAKATWLVPEGAEEFASFLSLVTKQEDASNVIFARSSAGVKTNRDDVVYDFDHEELINRVKKFIEAYNAEVDRYKRTTNTRKLKKNVDDFVKYNEIKWSESLKKKLMVGESFEFDPDQVREAVYRPFTRRRMYFGRDLNERTYGMGEAFPVANAQNTLLCVPGLGGRAVWAALVSNGIPNLTITSVDSFQCVPFYLYDEDGSNRRENITDWALKTFRSVYGDKKISKWDIFHYVYGMLHHPGYREKFKDSLKKELPRIPFAGFGKPKAKKPVAEFSKFVAAGEALKKLHLDYEEVEPWELVRIEKDGATYKELCHVEKMRLSKDKKSLKVNKFLTLQGIPERCFDYRLGNRSALEWVIDQYRIKTDKKTGIVSDPNREDDPEYIINLVARVIRVSMETLDIIDKLPKSYGGPPPKAKASNKANK